MKRLSRPVLPFSCDSRFAVSIGVSSVSAPLAIPYQKSSPSFLTLSVRLKTVNWILCEMGTPVH